MAAPDPAPDLGDPAVASAFDELPLWSAPFGLRLLETVRLAPALTVLDVGLGTGFPLLELARRLGPSARLYGVDPWAPALARARSKALTYALGNVVLLRAVAERLPLRDGRVDLVVSNNGLNNVEDPARALAECRRVAKPGAQLVLTQNLPETMRAFYDVYESVLRECGLDASIDALRRHIHSKRRPLEEVRALLAAAGFDTVEVSEGSFSLRFLDATALFSHFFVRLGFLEAWRSVPPERETERVFALLERRLDELAGRRGELRLDVPFACLDCRARE
jgi:ubiquinone/menaquinone biosynthesis C-methylase UbiE